MSGTARSGAADGGLPRVNHLVRLSVAGSGPQADGEAAESVPTRVENFDAAAGRAGRPRYTVAAPRYDGDVEPPQPGTACTLEWPGPRGLWILPMLFVGQDIAADGLRLWVLDVIGAARQNERRCFVRVDWVVPVTLVTMSAAEVRRAVVHGSAGAVMAASAGPAAGPGAAPSVGGDPLPARMTGETRNVSEGGIRCLLPAPQLPTGLGVAVQVELSGQPFQIPARLTWVRPTGLLGPLQFDVALAFDAAGAHGDRLRPLLFAEQLRVRRAGLA